MRTVAVGRAVLARARDTELPFLAAAIAYYALVSVVPALLLAVAVATTIGGEAFADRITASVTGLVTPTGQAAIEAALTDATGRTGVSVLGLAVLTWSTLKVFRGLDTAFSSIYGTTGRDSWLHGLGDAAVVLVAVGAGLGGMVALGSVVAALNLPVIGRLLGLAVLLVGLFGAFLPLYYRFPDVAIPVREAVPGAALAAVGWVGLQAAFQVYAALAPRQLYGVLGAVLLLVTWFYLGAALLLVGAVVNVVLAGGDRQAEMPRDRGIGPSMDGLDDDQSLEEQVAALRQAVEALETRLEEHTVPRSEVEADLKQYVRSRVRRSHARGWGPYLVLLYGTAMTVGAFYLLSGGWAILAMVVVWLSTLGLYVLMVLTGVAMSALVLPGRALDAIRDFRS